MTLNHPAYPCSWKKGQGWTCFANLKSEQRFVRGCVVMQICNATRNLRHMYAVTNVNKHMQAYVWPCFHRSPMPTVCRSFFFLSNLYSTWVTLCRCNVLSVRNSSRPTRDSNPRSPACNREHEPLDRPAHFIHRSHIVILFHCHIFLRRFLVLSEKYSNTPRLYSQWLNPVIYSATNQWPEAYDAIRRRSDVILRFCWRQFTFPRR